MTTLEESTVTGKGEVSEQSKRGADYARLFDTLGLPAEWARNCSFESQ
jgi:hypothetical protein